MQVLFSDQYKENSKFIIKIGLTIIGIIISIAVVKLDLIHISDNYKMEQKK